jgi:hypothetical protein
MCDTQLLVQMSSFLLDYPFADRLYPNSINTIKPLSAFGTTVILSNGDVVFQPLKIQRSGLWYAVGGRVLIFTHKEQMLADIEGRYPAHHYIMVDNKLRILSSMKKIWENRLTTVFPHQGHYALDRASVAAYPLADIVIKNIGELLNFDLSTFILHT